MEAILKSEKYWDENISMKEEFLQWEAQGIYKGNLKILFRIEEKLEKRLKKWVFEK